MGLAARVRCIRVGIQILISILLLACACDEIYAIFSPLWTTKEVKGERRHELGILRYCISNLETEILSSHAKDVCYQHSMRKPFKEEKADNRDLGFLKQTLTLIIGGIGAAFLSFVISFGACFHWIPSLISVILNLTTTGLIAGALVVYYNGADVTYRTAVDSTHGRHVGNLDLGFYIALAGLGAAFLASILSLVTTLLSLPLVKRRLPNKRVGPNSYNQGRNGHHSQRYNGTNVMSSV